MKIARHAAFGLSLGVTAVLFVNLCAMVFGCGCRSLWNGIASACNIHAVDLPHCPWSEHPLLGGGVAFAATVVVQWAVCHLPERVGFARRLALGVLAFPLTSGVVAWIQGRLWSYWTP